MPASMSELFLASPEGSSARIRAYSDASRSNCGRTKFKSLVEGGITADSRAGSSECGGIRLLPHITLSRVGLRCRECDFRKETIEGD
jgi:hypothetical protein